MQALFLPVKEEIDSLLKETVDADLFERMQQAKANPRTSFTPSLESGNTHIKIISAHEDIAIPFNAKNKRETEILDEKRIHHTVMNLLNPIDISRLDSAFNTLLQQKSIRALKTCVCFIDNEKISYTSGSNSFLIFRSDTLILDMEKKLKVQISLIPSPGWIADRTPLTTKFTGIACILLFLSNFLIRSGRKPVYQKRLPYRRINMLPPHVVPWYKKPTQKAIMPVCHLSTDICKIENGFYCIGNMIFDSERKILINHMGERKNIRKRKECELLQALLDAPEFMLSHKDVKTVLQLTMYSPESVRTTIYRLRKYLSSGTVSVKSIRSQGYKLAAVNGKKAKQNDKLI